MNDRTPISGSSLRRPRHRHLAAAFAAVLAVAMGAALSPATAQSRIKEMPGYANWAEMSPKIPPASDFAAITPVWASDSRSFEYTFDGSKWRYDVRRRRTKDIGPASMTPRPAFGTTGSPSETPLVLARGRGAEADVTSPDGKWRAYSGDYNMWLTPRDGSGSPIALSTDGGAAARIRNGVGSYVYLEEFNVRSPVWWSPDSRKVAWMRFDETKVQDYFLQLDQTKTQSTVLTQAYPHPGADNPVPDYRIYDVRSGKTISLDVRGGQPFSNEVIGHYAWSGDWTKDGSELLIRRADRLQKVFDLAACSAETGACRSVVREERSQSWASGSQPVFLNDGKRFVWTSERNGYRNFYLYHLDGRQLATLTSHAFDVIEVQRVDEKDGVLWYTARSGDNHMKTQLHRVKLDGSDDRRITDPAFHHRASLSPDGRYVVDTAQTHNSAPVSRLLDASGKVLAEIARADTSEMTKARFGRAEAFSFLSADGQTRLHGVLQFPSDFDPAKKYPALATVYGGPGSAGAAETFYAPHSLAEFGFVIVRMDARTAPGYGRELMDTVYQQLGVAEIDDFAAGLKSLRDRPWFDADRVGMFGTSYGGSVSALTLMRHPDVVQAAVSNSPVSDYRLYDTVYSERYLGLPQTNPDAYDRAAALTYVEGLKGDLMIFYGTSDDNVHPKNALQLIRALQGAGKSFEVMVGPDRGHTSMDQLRMMEFFIERLGPGS